MLSLVRLSLTRSRDGVRLFRWQAARDVGCILDVNPSATAWRCMPSPFGVDGITYVPDFQVFDEDGATLRLDAPDRVISVDGPPGPFLTAMHQNPV